MAMEIEVNRSQVGFPYWNPVRRRFKPDSPFFSDGNVERQLLTKQVALDLTEDEKQQVRSMEEGEQSNIYCPIAGCGACLKNLDAFEDHYNARHTASCSVCSRVYPTSRLLSIHVSEVHDSFFQAKVARGYPMYECLVEGCDVKLKSYKSRHQHLIDKHKFPSAFEFFKKAQPSKKQRQKQKHHHHHHHRNQLGETEKPDKDMKIDEDTIDSLVSGVSKLTTSTSPANVSFGRRHTRGLTFVPRMVVERTGKQGPSEK